MNPPVRRGAARKQDDAGETEPVCNAGKFLEDRVHGVGRGVRLGVNGMD